MNHQFRVNYKDLTGPNSPQMVVYVGDIPPTTRVNKFTPNGGLCGYSPNRKFQVGETNGLQLAHSDVLTEQLDPYPAARSVESESESEACWCTGFRTSRARRTCAAKMVRFFCFVFATWSLLLTLKKWLVITQNQSVMEPVLKGHGDSRSLDVRGPKALIQ